ncbi:hypothetical protein [Bifidobacterium pseudolongum]|nr:hypothetical protein [Bifidobacterium pseudolongum]
MSDMIVIDGIRYRPEDAPKRPEPAKETPAASERATKRPTRKGAKRT